jgi:hypothetical protein
MKIDLPVIPPADIQPGWDGQYDKRCSGGETSGFCQLDVEGFGFAG